jgi:hypothetical protein
MRLLNKIMEINEKQKIPHPWNSSKIKRIVETEVK